MAVSPRRLGGSLVSPMPRSAEGRGSVSWEVKCLVLWSLFRFSLAHVLFILLLVFYWASSICNFMISINLGKLLANFSSNIAPAPFSLFSLWNFSYLYTRPFHNILFVSYILFCILHSFVSQCLSGFFSDLSFTSLILSLAVSILLINLSTKLLIISSCVFQFYNFYIILYHFKPLSKW